MKYRYTDELDGFSYVYEAPEPDYRMGFVFPHVHYSNPYWNTARTIWGAEEEGLHYEYSDRQWEWDYNKADRCHKEARERAGDRLTPARIQLFLTLYHGREVELRHVMAGVNVSNGWDYYVYGFRFKGDEGD